jgi:hypothetical protein
MDADGDHILFPTSNPKTKLSACAKDGDVVQSVPQGFESDDRQAAARTMRRSPGLTVQSNEMSPL